MFFKKSCRIKLRQLFLNCKKHNNKILNKHVFTKKYISAFSAVSALSAYAKEICLLTFNFVTRIFLHTR